MSIKKKVAAVLCALCCFFCCALTVSANTFFDSVIINDDYDVEGSESITVSEAVYALSVYFNTSSDNVAKAFEFKVVPETKVVEVYEDGELVEVIYTTSDGYYSGIISGVLVLKASTNDVEGLEGVILCLTDGVKGVFSIIAAGFDFITSNALCMFIISISFAGVAFAFVKCGMRTARK